MIQPAAAFLGLTIALSAFACVLPGQG